VLAAASCAALVAAWRLGDQPSQSSGLGLKVVAPPPSTGSPSPTATAPSASRSRATKGSTSKASATSSSPRSFTGSTVQTQYGDVQVRVVVAGPKVTDVVALRLTDSSSRSVQISAYAAPILRREALSAQSARIDTVSGASYTSAGYIQSLQAALDAARAG
jgi:uncharacterized protein with FMN-binding domain